MMIAMDVARFYGNQAQLEVFLIYIIAGLGILLRNVVYRVVQRYGLDSTRSAIFVQEFACAVLPMVLAQTLLADRIVSLFISLVALISVILFADKFLLHSKNAEKQRPTVLDRNDFVRNSVSWYRMMVFLSTSIAILAVDFEVFPRRFAKTERFGHSLMDSGTAAFVFVNGLSDYRNVVVNRGEKRNPYFSLLSLRIPSFFVLLVMGVGRSAFILLYGYQQNVTEYGVHWNFFVTLFCLRVFVELFSYPYSMYVGLFIGIFYEFALTKFGLADFILRDEIGGRSGFLDENREGIFSLFGYIFLYSLALLYARISMPALQRSPTLTTIFTHGLSFVGVFIGMQKFVECLNGVNASRRLANMPYTFAMASLFSLSVSGLQVFGYCAGAPPASSKFAKHSTVQAISANGLLYFLVSNLVTGLVNIFVLNVYKLEHNALFETLFIALYAFLTIFFITAVNWKKKVE